MGGSQPRNTRKLGRVRRDGLRLSLFVYFVVGSWPLMVNAQPVLPPPGISDVDEVLRVKVNGFVYRGNTVFSDAELDEVLAGYVGRMLGTAELDAARRKLTVHYVRNGYVNSGAVLADQDLEGGLVEFTITEGTLSGVVSSGNRRLRSRVLQRRVERYAVPPLNLHRLQEGLLLLREDENVERVNAELKPGEILGSSVLALHVEEANPWHVGLELRNDRPPSVGATTLETRLAHSNVSGNGDRLEWRYGIAHGGNDDVAFSGFDDWGASYTLPLPYRGMSVRGFYDETDFDVIEEPFADLGVKSQTKGIGFAVRYPLIERLHRTVSLSLSAERRRSRSEVFGEPFSLSAGAVEGETTVSVLRFSQEWIERSQRRVLALRSTLSVGVDALSSTDDGTDRDGTFVSWLGQGQYILRLGGTQNRLVLSGTVQLSSDPLLSLEQFSLGGAYTVRGYRENQMVRDMGVIGSLEFHAPVWKSRTGRSILSLVPFVDVGAGWNAEGPTPSGSDIASAGVGLVFEPHERVSGRLFWGHAFRDVGTGEDDLQDYGIHFRLMASVW